VKKGIYIFIFIIFCLNTKAQKYGVSVGYAYSYGKGEFRPDFTAFDQNYYEPADFKFKLFPNAFIRPYIKLYKGICFFSGVEITKYEILFHKDIEHQYLWDIRINQSDLHFPVGLKYNFMNEENKMNHTLYGGLLFLYHYKGTKYYLGAPNNNLTRPEGFKFEPNLYIYNNQKICFMTGYEFNYKLKDWFSLSANAYVKYTPVFLDYSSPLTTDSSPYIRNKFSFSISIGCSFMKPYKQKEEEASKVFRLDD